MNRKLLLSILCAYLSMWARAQDNQLLFAAVDKNDIQAVKKLLDQGANPNAIDEYGDAVLMNAALYASVDCMKLLLDKGANPNFKNKEGETALMWCVQDADKLKILLEKGADINAKAKSGNTPLLIAVVGYNNYDRVKFLIEKGADPLAMNNFKETALVRAAPVSDSKTINLLLEKGVPIDSVSPASSSALILAILYANQEVALTLLEKGADPDVADSYSGPLSAAVSGDDTAVISLLIRKQKTFRRPMLRAFLHWHGLLITSTTGPTLCSY